MVSTSKILTVSYGTFSCTLEGFDDSFGTMKAIAEYFRGLASDDRYFGAEPPTPDSEMLARIAEREISRQVEARQERGQIVLRAADRPATTGTPAPETADAAATARPGAAKTDAAPAEPGAEPRPETLAEAGPVPEAASEAEPPPETAPEPVAETTAEPEADEAGTAEVAPPDTAADEAGTAEPLPRHTVAETESVAAKLRRIRAVVSQGTASATAAPGYSEDEHADDAAAEPVAEPADVSATADEAADEAAGTDDAQVSPEARRDTDPETAASAPADAAQAVEQAAQQDTVPEDDAAPQRAEVLKVKRADFDEALAPETPEAPEAPDPDAAAPRADAADDSADDIAADDWGADWDTGEESTLSPEEEAELRRELAQVEAELGVGSDAAADRQADDEPAGAAEQVADATGSDDDDDDDDDDYDDDEVGSIFAETGADAHESRHDRIARRERLYKTADEQDMNRLIAKTQSEMAEPQAANRRNAIAHLRAAVAATTAEIEAGQGGGRRDSAPAADHGADTVRPRRPARAGGAATRRPSASEGAAPLKLVAEQRIDTAEPAQPVKPRRVSRAALDAAEDETATPTPTPTAAPDDGFATFAASVGAHDLAEILEAAAAYLTFVEERADFSRPQLMTRVRALQGDAFSREDGLRSFGQLLRNGKLRKLGGGRFTASQEIGFQQEARRAG